MDLVPTAQYGFTDQPVPQPASLYVPRSAVLLAGENSIVYVETKPGRFEIRPVTVGPILRDKIVILAGLKPNESVATAGNFLIDSQMQLAGKPSLIDPARAIANAKQRKGPLEFAEIAVSPLSGDAGQQLETLYTAYFQIQKALAADRQPPPATAQQLHATAQALSADAAVPEPSQKLIQEIAANSEHLHHQDLDAARKAFKPISHAVVALATQVRSADAQLPFIHFFCPMVPEGGGDWLQPDSQLLNPYFGSQMLRCGEKVHEFPAHTPPAANSDQHEGHGAAEKQPEGS
jgi:Cu(I)/Ag(I) efflux system membrane fusion protein